MGLEKDAKKIARKLHKMVNTDASTLPSIKRAAEACKIKVTGKRWQYVARAAASLIASDKEWVRNTQINYTERVYLDRRLHGCGPSWSIGTATKMNESWCSVLGTWLQPGAVARLDIAEIEALCERLEEDLAKSRDLSLL